MSKTFFKIVALIFAMVLSIPSYAATPSPAMIAQLKKLPKSEQQRLMKQYGITAKDLAASEDNKSDVLVQEEAIDKAELPEDEVEKKAVSDELKRFGLELFRNRTGSFDNTSVAVPDFYLLGAGDKLLVQVYGKQNSNEELMIERDGNIQLPDLGPVLVAGLTFAEAKELITTRIKTQVLGVEVAVSMGELKTIPVFIAGEARKPGSYNVPAMSSITQALSIAGGISDIGSLREVSIKRNGATIVTFDLYDLLLRGDASNDQPLQAGDVVFVSSVKSLVKVEGATQRPAIYEVMPGETVQDLLAMAGGVKADAYPQGAVLERVNSKNVRDLLNLDLTNPSNLQELVKSGDVLRIGSTSARIQNSVTLAGAVIRPGIYAWKPGMRVNDLIKSLWSDLHVSADLSYGLIIREETLVGELDVLQFNIADALNSEVSEHNIALSPRDLVLVFHQGEQAVERGELNEYLLEKINKFDSLELEKNSMLAPEQPNSNSQPKLKAESLAEQAFELLNIRQHQSDRGEVPIALDSRLNLLVVEMNRLLSFLFTDPELLKKTPQLRRKELLLPVLRKIKSKTNFSKGLQVLYVSGEVKVPGEYPLPRNATVKKLIEAAGGLKESAYLQRAEITRATQSSLEADILVEHLNVDITQVLSDEQSFGLQSRDTLNVFAIPNWNIKRQVRVYGEVRFPGVYSIQQGESLAGVLRRAGGLKATAFAEGTVFTRTQAKAREEEQVRKLTQQLRADIAARSLSADVGAASPQDAMQMISELEKIKPVGRLVVDLQQIMSMKSDHDLLAEDGDELFVPAMNASVSVVGEVQHAASHRFSDDLTLDDYLKLSGGFRKRADSERVYVIRADGSVFLPEQNSWFSVTEQRLQPGDTIVVPLDTEFKDGLNMWAEITQIFYQSAVALAALNSF